MSTLETLRFDNTYVKLPDIFGVKLNPTPFSKPPYLVSFNPEGGALLDLDPREAGRTEFLEYFTGARILPGSNPVAMLYAGHQFGHYVPQLGDGRAILLGEVIDADGIRRDIQLKGSGPTPFSRRGDGRAALGPVLREYIVSEAMATLGIPTTRSLAA